MKRCARVTAVLLAGLLIVATVVADESVVGVVKSVDVKANKVTVTVLAGKSRDDKAFPLAKDAKILVNGQPKKLEDLAAGSRVSLKLNDDKKVIEINSRSGERPTERPKDAGKDRPSERPTVTDSCAEN